MGPAGGPGLPWGRGCTVRRPLGMGTQRPGLGRGRDSSYLRGEARAQMTKVAQAAGFGLRRGFSITTSPAQERAGRGAAPRAAEARAGGGGGAPSWGGRGTCRSFLGALPCRRP